MSFAERVEEELESRRAEATHQEGALAEPRGEPLRQDHAAVAVHVGEDHDELGALDEGAELLRSAAVDVARVELEAVSLGARLLLVASIVAGDATNHSDAHDD